MENQTNKLVTKFIIDTKDFMKGIKSAKSSVNNFSHSVSSTSRSVNTFTNGIRKSSDSLTTMTSKLAGAVGGLALLKKGFDIAVGFDNQMKELSSITGLMGDDLEFLGRKAKEFGVSFGVGAGKAAEAFKLAASAKDELLKDPTGLVNVTKQAILLSKAGGIELPSAIDTLVGSLNQYNAGADRAAEFTNILAAGARSGSSEISDTAAAIQKAGIIAAQAGLKFSELNAFIQVLAKNTLKGEEAGTAIRNFLVNTMTKGIDQLNPKVVGITKALENLNKMNLSEDKLKELFDVRGIRTAQIVMQNTELFKQFTTEIVNTNSAAEQTDIVMTSLGNRLGVLWGKIENVAITIGDTFAPEIQALISLMGGLADTVSNVISKISELKTGFQKSKIGLYLQNDLSAAFDRLAMVGKFAKNAVTGGGFSVSPDKIGIVGSPNIGGSNQSPSELNGDNLTSKIPSISKLFGNLKTKTIDLAEAMSKGTNKIQTMINSFMSGKTGNYLNEVLKPALEEKFGSKRKADPFLLTSFEKSFRDVFEQTIGAQPEDATRLNRQLQRLERDALSFGFVQQEAVKELRTFTASKIPNLKNPEGMKEQKVKFEGKVAIFPDKQSFISFTQTEAEKLMAREAASIGSEE